MKPSALPLAIAFLCSACAAQTGAFGLSESAIESRLRSGDYAFLEELDPARAPEARGLGPGAAYALGLRARACGKDGLALGFWRLEREGGAEPEATEAGRRILETLRAQGDWAGLGAEAGAFLASHRGDAGASIDRAEALLRTGDAALASAALDGADLPAAEPEAQRARALRILLDYKGKKKGRDSRLLSFLETASDPQALRSLSSCLLASPPLAAPKASPAPSPSAELSPRDQALLEARVLILDREYHKARLAFIAAGFPSAFASPPVALSLDAGKAWLYGGGAAEGSGIFAEAAASASGQAAAAARLYQGRCLDAQGKKAEARGAWRKALAAAEPGSVRDAAAWFLVDSSFAVSAAEGIAAVRETSPLWVDPAYFSDILEGRICDLVKAGDAGGLASLGDALGPGAARAAPAVAERLISVIGRMGRAAGSTEGPSPAQAEAARAFSPGVLDPFSYYRLADSFGPDGQSSGDPFSGALALAALADAGPPRASADPPPSPGAGLGEEALASLLLRYGLSGTAADYSSRPAVRASLGAEGLRRLAREASGYGEEADAASLAALAAKEEGRLRLGDLELLYPRPYAAETGAAAAASGFPVELLYGLVRTESWFGAGISSAAGAVGLTQLMPSTAAGVAAKMRLERYDLRDPATNLLLGARYLRSLVDYFDGDLLLALMAYNGGMGRVRKLRADSPSLPDDLFLETVSVSETRNYGRKVLAAAAAYGYLYGDAAAASKAYGALPGPSGAAGQPGAAVQTEMKASE